MSTSPESLILLALLGAISGFLNVTAGGGSLLTVPALVFLGLPGPVANGTNRIGILLQNLTAIWAFRNRGFSAFKLSFSLSLVTLPGALAGAYMGVELDGELFNKVLAGVMIGVMIIMQFQGNWKTNETVAERPPIPRSRLIWGHILMALVGIWGGFIQIGVGFLMMPILSRVMGLSLIETNMHKVFIIAFFSIVALTVFASAGQIVWLLGGALAIGNMVGAYVAVRVSIARGEKFIYWMLNAMLVLMIAKLLWDS